MPFIGQQPTTGAFLELDSLTASATADYTLQLNGANYYPESVNNLLVSINGVIQGSNTMSLSGSTLTVGATLSSSDVIDFVRVFGNVGTISTPTDGSVTVNKLGTGAVTNAKIADSTLDLTSKVTGVLPVANGGTGVSSGFSYETGTFTPDVYHSSSNNSTFTAKNGEYTKIGNTVTAQIRVDSGNSGTAGSNLVIGGLPYAPVQANGTMSIGIWGASGSQVGNVMGNSTPQLYKGGTGVTTQISFFTAMLVYRTS